MPRKTDDDRPGLGRGLASMRPRPDAAENRVHLVPPHLVSPLASMRPRPDAAENPQRRSTGVGIPLASMRPRPDAAENARPSTPAARPSTRFNEAAARCRGKLILDRLKHGAITELQ